MTQSRWINHVPCRALVLGTLLSILASCSSTDELEDMTFQRDRLQEALENTVEQLERERNSVKGKQAEVDRVAADLDAEKKKVLDLSDAVERVTTQKAEIEAALKKQDADFSKLRETHTKLGKMAQESLDELSELRQRNESLGTEKKSLETKAVVLNKQVVSLSREVDDLRLELDKTRKAVEVIQSNGGDAGERAELNRLANEKSRLEDVASAQKEQIVTLSTELVEMRSSLSKFEEFEQESADAVTDPAKLFESSRELFQDRYKKALNGEIAWDAFDVVVVSTAGAVVVCSLLWVLFFVRHLKLRRRYKQSLLEADELEQQLYDLEQEVEEQQQGQAAAAAAASRRQVLRDEQAAEERSERLSPNEFSPIMRTQREVPPQAQETVAIAAAPAQRPAAQSQGSAGSRRVIGAYREDTGPQAAARPAPVPAAAAASAPPAAEEDTGAQTQIISEADIDLLSEAGALQPSNLQLSSAKRAQAEQGQQAPPKVARAAAEKTQQVSGGGTNEEQELLDELKNIINKKFDDVLTDDD